MGSARYTDLAGDSEQARELKQRALLNLKRQGISALIVIGGDGSLAGAQSHKKAGVIVRSAGAIFSTSFLKEAVDGENFQHQVESKIQGLSRTILLGNSFSTVIFFSRRPERADQAFDYINKKIREAGINMETSLVSMETSLGGIVPTVFDRILAQRLGEKALTTLQKNRNSGAESFPVTGIQRKEITATSELPVACNG